MPFRMRKIGLCALAVSLLCGCSEVSHKIVGVWEATGGPTPITITFQPDGTYKTEAPSADGPVITTGEYRKEGNTVYMNGQHELSLTVHLESDNLGETESG